MAGALAAWPSSGSSWPRCPPLHLLGGRPDPGHGGPDVSIGTLVAFVSLQQGLFRPAVSPAGHRRADADLARPLPAHLRVPRPAGRHHRARATRVDLRPGRAARSASRASTSPTTPERDAHPRRHRHRPCPRAAAWRRRRRPAPARRTLSYLVRGCTTSPAAGSPIDGVDVRDLDFDTLAARGRRRLPGDLPLPRLGRRQPALRQARRHRRGDRRRPRGPRRSTTTSRRCPTATTPWSASAATGSPAARSSAWPSPAPSCATRPC